MKSVEDTSSDLVLVLACLPGSMRNGVPIVELVESLAPLVGAVRARLAVSDALAGGFAVPEAPYEYRDGEINGSIRLTPDGVRYLVDRARRRSASEEMGALWRAGKYQHCPVCNAPYVPPPAKTP